jgi:hypothetical protein
MVSIIIARIFAMGCSCHAGTTQIMNHHMWFVQVRDLFVSYVSPKRSATNWYRAAGAPGKGIASQEREYKWNYLEACLLQRQHFTPFVCSPDGLMGHEATKFAKRQSTIKQAVLQKDLSRNVV